MLSDIQRPVSASVVKSIWRSVLAGNAGPTPLPDPTTVNFTASQISSGFAGSISTTKNAARIYGRASLTLWCGIITGSEAKITANSDNGSAAWPGLIQVAVDGGPFAAAPNVGTLFTLFTGLTHGPHLVEFRFGNAVGATPYILATGDVLSVTGQPPSILPISGWVQPVADAVNGGTVVNTATYTPPLMAVRGTTYGSNIGTVKLRGAFTKLTVLTACSTNKVAVSKNGSAPTFYTATAETNSPSRSIVIPCDGSDSTYYVWNNGTDRTGGGHFAVAGDSALLSAGNLHNLDQYGDSITYGTGPGATPVDVETMRVAAALGMIGSTNGIGGYTIAQCKTLIDVVVPTKVITSNDVAILAIGRNNVSGGIDATEQADYGLCIDKLVAAGYGKVLCRAVIPTPNGSSMWTVENAALQSVVTAKANPNVIWVPTETWLGYDSQDATHPTAAGYATIAGYAVPAYTTALGL